jgi:hypothetical protein
MVSADSGQFYRISEIQLNGERAPKTIEVEFREVPQGAYDIVAIVKDSTGHERSVARRSATFAGV